MQKQKNFKIKYWIGLFYLLLLSFFLYVLFSKFSIEEITTYKFIKSNSEYLINIRQNNIILVSLVFVLFGILWVLLQGFGSPLALASGFLLGPYLGTLISVTSLSIGATIIYIFANSFFKELIREKFLNKFKNLEIKFKKKEFFYMLLYRFVGGIPFQISNIIPCIFNVKIKNFLFATFLGIIPQIFIIASLGAGLESQIEKNSKVPSFVELITSFEIYAPIIGFLLLLIFGFLSKKLFYKN
tara:strand:+ start:164 stop:889 length:726 start_codon:yes stop_codon:yes gene_type:complete